MESQTQQSFSRNDKPWLDGNRQNISSCMLLISEKSPTFAMKSSASEVGTHSDGSGPIWVTTPLSFKSCGAMMSSNSPSKLGKALLTARLFSSSSLRFDPWVLFLNLKRLDSSCSRCFSCSLKILHLSRKIARTVFSVWWISPSRKPCWIAWLRTWSRERRKTLQHN